MGISAIDHCFQRICVFRTRDPNILIHGNSCIILFIFIVKPTEMVVIFGQGPAIRSDTPWCSSKILVMFRNIFAHYLKWVFVTFHFHRLRKHTLSRGLLLIRNHKLLSFTMRCPHIIASSNITVDPGSTPLQPQDPPNGNHANWIETM